MSRSERYIRSPEKLEQAIKKEREWREHLGARRESLLQALTKQKRDKLIGLLVELADEKDELALWILDRLDVRKRPSSEAIDIESDIARATHVPEPACFLRDTKVMKSITPTAHSFVSATASCAERPCWWRKT